MLIVYRTFTSPGALTAAMHIAAHWASTDREVVLIEADPAGGSLSQNLGIQFTPGSASLVASGLPMRSDNLIDHSQDVLFENLHVVPAPSNPVGARPVVELLERNADELRAISEDSMAVIIDGGRVTADTAASALARSAVGVAVVIAGDADVSSLDYLHELASASPQPGEPQGFAVTIGRPKARTEEEIEQVADLAFCGLIELTGETMGDLSAFVSRNTRRLRKWRASVERIGDSLYPYARPSPSEAAPATTPPQDRGPAGIESPGSSAPETSGTPAADEFPRHGSEHGATSSQQPQPGFEPPPAQPQPGFGPPPGVAQPPPELPQPGVAQPQPGFGPPPGVAQPQPGVAQPQPGFEPPPAYEQPSAAPYPPGDTSGRSGAYPHGGVPGQPTFHGQGGSSGQSGAYPPAEYPRYETAGPPAEYPRYETAGPPAEYPRYETAGPPAGHPRYETAGPPAGHPRDERYETAGPPAAYPSTLRDPAHEQASAPGHGRPATPPAPSHEDSAPAAPLPPSGSFREWASRLYSLDEPDRRASPQDAG